MELCERVLEVQLQIIISLDKSSGAGEKHFTALVLCESNAPFHLCSSNLDDSKYIPAIPDQIFLSLWKGTSAGSAPNQGVRPDLLLAAEAALNYFSVTLPDSKPEGNGVSWKC